MPRTRVFKSGNSQAVRIPAELAYADTDIDLEITRLGDVITIVPARNSLKDAVSARWVESYLYYGYLENGVPFYPSPHPSDRRPCPGG